MNKKSLGAAMEWIRPIGIGAVIFFAYYIARDAATQFHLMGPFIVILICGTVAFEAIVLGEAVSEKIGYAPNRAYQVQSGLANAAIAITALIVYVLNWGRYADATIVSVMLIFFSLSATNHAITAFRDGNMKPVNLMRPVMAILLVGFLLPLMIKSLG